MGDAMTPAYVHHGLWDYRPGKEISVCGEHFEPCNATTLAYATARLRALDGVGDHAGAGAAAELRLRAWLHVDNIEPPCVHRLGIDGWCVYCGRSERVVFEEAKAAPRVVVPTRQEMLPSQVTCGFTAAPPPCERGPGIVARVTACCWFASRGVPPCERGPGIVARTDLPSPPTPLVLAYDDPTGDDVCAPADSALWVMR